MLLTVLAIGGGAGLGGLLGWAAKSKAAGGNC